MNKNPHWKTTEQTFILSYQQNWIFTYILPSIFVNFFQLRISQRISENSTLASGKLHQYISHTNKFSKTWIYIPNLQAVLYSINWKPFILYVLNGLIQSTNFCMKFKSRGEDTIDLNDFVHQCFGAGGSLHIKNFEYFFSVQYPRLYPQSHETHSNFKKGISPKQIQ